MSVVLSKTQEGSMCYYYLSLDRNVAKTLELNDDVFLDIHKNGDLLGLESIDQNSLKTFLASQGFEKPDIDENVEEYLEGIIARRTM